MTPVELTGANTPCPLGLECYRYDGDRKLTTKVLTDGTSISYQYGATTDLLNSVSVPGSGTTSFVYDSEGRRTSATAPDGAQMTWGYQAKLPVRTTWQGTHTVRDGANTVWTGALNGQLKTFYNGFFETDRLQVVNGFDAKYARDLDGFVTGVTNNAGGTTVPALGVSRSNLDGTVTGTSLGVVSTIETHDTSASTPGFGDLIALSASANGASLFSVTYTRDDMGRIKSVQETVQGSLRERHYTYDNAGRLTHVRDGENALVAQWEYDFNGNRIRETNEGVTHEASCADGRATNDLDQLCEYGDYSYVYDERGTLRTTSGPEGTTTYTYDVAGRLTKVALPGSTVIHYVFDAMGRRIGKVKNGAFVRGWLYADDLRPIAQLNASGAIEATYVYSTRSNVPDYVVEKVGTSNVTYRVIADHFGTPRLLVRVSDGAVVWRLDVDEWGTVTADSGAKQDLLPHGFAGGLRDRDTGLTRFGARDYEAYAGRWTARDPILFAGGQGNLYGYAGGDPINRTDPEGESAVGVVVPVAGGLAAADGLLPIGDVAAGILIAGAFVWDMCHYNPPTDDCRKVKQDCIEQCSDSSLPTPDGLGWDFWNCLNACMRDNGC